LIKDLFSPIRMLFPPERIIPVILFLDSKITSDKIYYVNF